MSYYDAVVAEVELACTYDETVAKVEAAVLVASDVLGYGSVASV